MGVFGRLLVSRLFQRRVVLRHVRLQQGSRQPRVSQQELRAHLLEGRAGVLVQADGGHLEQEPVEVDVGGGQGEEDLGYVGESGGGDVL